jgi:hypothetical protein
MPNLGGPKRGAPAFAEVFAPMVTIKGIEVTIGKRRIEPFHMRSVLEAPGEDAFVQFDRNVVVESGEVAETTLLMAGEINYLIQLLQDFVDRTGRQRNSHSCLQLSIRSRANRCQRSPAHSPQTRTPRSHPSVNRPKRASERSFQEAL